MAAESMGDQDEDQDKLYNSRNNGQAAPLSSYADRLRSNISFSQRLNRNILEITLEKIDKQKSSEEISDENVATVFRTLGIDISIQLEGYQIQYRGSYSVLSVWFKQGINLEKFCKDVSIRVNSEIRTGLIRPAGKSEVTVTISGLDFNTPDTFVIDYLNKFGVVKNRSVIYTKFDSGPFKGMFTGERKYEVNFSDASTHMGTYHLIDGCRTRVFYRGNLKTCGRCHKVASECLGGGLARDCEAAGGIRVLLSSHMKILWEKVGFIPSSFELNLDEQSADNRIIDVPLFDATEFPKKQARAEPSERDINLSDGLTVKNIPKHVEVKNIFEFLLQNGLPEDHSIDQIRVNKGERNTWVVIEGLDANTVHTLYKNIHFPVSQKKFYEVSIYCNILRNTTPQKVSSINKEEENIIPGLSREQQKKALKKQDRDTRNQRVSVKAGKRVIHPRSLILTMTLSLKILIS